MNEKRHEDEVTRSYSEKGLGGDVFGPSTTTTRYRCPAHGELLAREIWWDRDWQPHCPHCDGPVTPIT